MAMMQDDLDHLADAWLGYWNWNAGERSPIRKRLSWARDRERELLYEDPEELWRLILVLHSKDHSPAIQQVLSAGPLEDLLAKHGEKFIERVEREARADREFARLLGGVWKSSMSNGVWARVQSAWDRRGWDGIPE